MSTYPGVQLGEKAFLISLMPQNCLILVPLRSNHHTLSLPLVLVYANIDLEVGGGDRRVRVVSAEGAHVVESDS